MPTRTLEKASARDRLLAAADELFYEQGIHTVGIDKVIERAGVAKASLYSTFGSKDELIRAYLDQRHARRKERMAAGLARVDTPREKLLAVYDVLDDLTRQPTFRGCAFINASAEAQPDSVVARTTAGYREWVHTLVHDLCVEAGASDPGSLARQLILLYDGALIAASIDHVPDAAKVARSVAEGLLTAALPRRPRRIARSR